MRLLLITLLIAIGLVGCSKEDSSKSPYLGERLMSLVDTIDSPPPAPNALNLLIKECNFKEAAWPSRHASDCQFTNIAPKRERAIEAYIDIDAITPHCCTTAVYISQGQLDQQGGLDLFANLSGVKKKELKCPKIQANNTPMDGSDFFEIVKDGKTKFFIREDYNRGGNGGQSTYTTVFFGKPKAMYAQDKIVEGCDYFAYMQDDFYAARRGESPATKQAGISSCADGKTAAEITACLARSPERVNKYENLSFISLGGKNDHSIDEFLTIGDDCNRLIKAVKRREPTGMVLVTKFGNDGFKTRTSYSSDGCGDGSDSLGGRTPKDTCNKFNNGPNKYRAGKLYFTDDSMETGIKVDEFSNTCTSFSSLKKIKGVQYQETSVAKEGCFDKNDGVAWAVSEHVKSRQMFNILVCSK